MTYDSGALLFEAEGRLKRGTKYVHISYLFDVEEVYNRIVIDLSLSPYRTAGHSPEMREEMKQAIREQIFITDPAAVQEMIEQTAPLRNMCSIAVRTPDGWRGEDHKFVESRTITLSESGTTPCFKNGRNSVGKYEIVLHVYAVFTDVCNYTLTVRGYHDAQ